MKGKCEKCGAVFYGWALSDIRKRKCTKCGGTVELVENVPTKLLSDVLAIRLRH
jgi:hypothetical protein